MEAMRTLHPHPVESAIAQPLTEALIGEAGIRPGMRVLVLGSRLAEIAPLVAERVGSDGWVIAAARDPRTVAEAQRCAAEEGFDRIEFRSQALGQIRMERPLDAVFGRFFLMHEPDPVRAVQCAAAMVREGGRVAFQEWHYRSILWTETADWPHLPLYQKFARCTIEGLRRRGTHADIGLNLINVFAAAGLRRAAARIDLRALGDDAAFEYRYFEETLRELLPESCAVEIEGFAQRLNAATSATRGHVFLPLQVGVWARVPADV
jgi:SAM-dependent methyltransferase